MFMFLTLVIIEEMTTITCNCAIYEVSVQEHLRKHGRNEVQAEMNRRSLSMPREAQPSGQSRGIRCALNGVENWSLFHRQVLDLRRKTYTKTTEVMGKLKT